MKKKIINLTERQIVNRQTQEALEEGRLYEECLKYYPVAVGASTSPGLSA